MPLEGSEVVLSERRGHIYLVTLNRPERRNAMSIELRRRFDEELRIFNDDPDLWVMVLTGAGDRAFCAGMDLKEYTDRVRAGGSPMTKHPGRAHHHVSSWKPMIAAINGDALAGGWAMAQRCDLRIAAEGARLGITENRWNLPAPFAAEQGVFPTSAIAAEVAMMARPISSERAREIGFVNEVVPAEDVLATAMSWAEHLCTLGQEALRTHKRLAYYGHWAPASELYDLSEELFYWVGNKPGVVVDASVGSRAFAEGRQPDYSAMFERPRMRCATCGAEYVVAADGSGVPAPCCHGVPLERVAE